VVNVISCVTKGETGHSTRRSRSHVLRAQDEYLELDPYPHDRSESPIIRGPLLDKSIARASVSPGRFVCRG
jgi:hypothetical protein